MDADIVARVEEPLALQVGWVLRRLMAGRLRQHRKQRALSSGSPCSAP
jgi:hypothetical protein